MKYGSGHEGVAVLLPGFAINWQQNQVTRQPHLHDLTHIYLYFLFLINIDMHASLKLAYRNIKTSQYGPSFR